MVRQTRSPDRVLAIGARCAADAGSTWSCVCWGVTPETAQLLRHWRYYPFASIRPFFFRQVEAVEMLIWLTEVAPGLREGAAAGYIKAGNDMSNPELARVALKLAMGAGKTTVMALIIAWQTVNAVRRPASNRFTKGFLVVSSGITIRDRLRVLQPNDPDSYYRGRESGCKYAAGSAQGEDRHHELPRLEAPRDV